MELDRFNLIRKRYGKLASWATWSPQNDLEDARSGIGDLSIFDPQNSKNVIRDLHTDFVLVALNVSHEDEGVSDWRNFHSNYHRNTDYKLRRMLSGTKLWGAYITDIFKNFPEPNSRLVLKYCKEHPDELSSQVETFRDEMELVCSGQTVLIAFGDIVFKILSDNLSKEFVVHKIPHYASMKTVADMRAECLKF